MESQTTGKYPCGSCLKHKNAQRFSESALKKYTEAVRHARGRSRSINSIRKPICSDCSVPSVHELECAKCGVTKSIEGFSKQQRKRNDERECKDCVQEREDREPNFHDQVREIEIMDRLQNGLGPRGAMPSVLDRMTNSQMSRLQSAHEHSIISGEHDASLQSLTNLSIDGRQSIAASGTEPSHTTTNTAWDNFQLVANRGHRRNHRASPSSDDDGSRFAKTAASKPDAETKAATQFERQQRRQQELAEQAAFQVGSEEDSDDSDDEAPY